MSTAAAPANRHDFKGLADWIEVFRAGSHTDSKGRACTFTTADLDQMVSNVALGRPPAVLGHPKHDDPAYGWAALKRDGTSLFAKFDDVNPAFEAGINSGAYRNRSVSVVSDKDHGWRVRHIGWLGAAPPAIDGLKPVDFAAADEADVHEFSASELWPASWALGDVGRLFRGLREWLIGKDGQETADRVIPDYTINSINEQAAALRQQAQAEAAEAAPLFTAPTGADNMPFSQEDLDRVRTETEARVRAEMTAAQSADFAAAQERLQTMETERRDERITGQVAGLVASGHVTPAEQPGVAEFLRSVDASAEFAFTAAGAEVKKTPAQWFLEFIAGRAPVVKLGQVTAGGESEGARVDFQSARSIADAAQEFQAAEAKAGRTVPIESAVAHVMSQNAAG